MQKVMKCTQGLFFIKLKNAVTTANKWYIEYSGTLSQDWEVNYWLFERIHHFD